MLEKEYSFGCSKGERQVGIKAVEGMSKNVLYAPAGKEVVRPV